MNLIEVEIRNGGLYQKGFDSSLISSISFGIGHADGPYTQWVRVYSSPVNGSPEVAPDVSHVYQKATAKAYAMARNRGRAHTLALFINGHFYAMEQIGQDFNRKADPNSKRSQKKAAR